MYSRFNALENFGETELDKLQNSTAAVVGLGATGSVIADHLARHGINLIIIDRDYLEENDLYSSNIYRKPDVEKSLPKAVAASEKLEDYSSIEKHVEDLTAENIEILDTADIVLDGTDNLETRLLISEYCRKNDKPWIYTAAIAEQGYSMFLQNTCFNCIFEQINASSLETCQTAGIMREVSSIAASKSALKAVNYLSGKDVDEKLEVIHTGEIFDIESEGCKVCEEETYENLESASNVSKLCGVNKFQLNIELSPKSLEKLRANADIEKENDYLIQTNINQDLMTVFKSGRVIVEAEDEGHARQRVSELLGV